VEWVDCCGQPNAFRRSYLYVVACRDFQRGALQDEGNVPQAVPVSNLALREIAGVFRWGVRSYSWWVGWVGWLGWLVGLAGCRDRLRGFT
jgi:hypothetical protein